MEEPQDIKPTKPLNKHEIDDCSYFIYTQGAIEGFRDRRLLHENITHKATCVNPYNKKTTHLFRARTPSVKEEYMR